MWKCSKCQEQHEDTFDSCWSCGAKRDGSDRHTTAHLSHSFSGLLRTFAYFMASGTQYTLEGVNYLHLYGNEPSAIEQVYAIFANVLELDESGQVLNAHYAQKRATDYLRAYCDSNFKVDPPYEDWELELHDPPPRQDFR